MRRALVLGAGGNAAIAWEIGMIFGMAKAGIHVRDADVFVGTSAGAVVAAQLTSGLTLEELFQQQVDPALQVNEPAPAVDFNRWRADSYALKRAPAAMWNSLDELDRLTRLRRRCRTLSGET
jgi:NTE family protein